MLTSPLIHGTVVDDSIKKRTVLISDKRVRIMLCVLGLSRYLGHILRSITTVLGMIHRGDLQVCNLCAVDCNQSTYIY